MGDSAVVSGAGSGIGRAVAIRLAAKGYQVALLGRRPEALAETSSLMAGTDHRVFAGDLTVPAVVGNIADAIKGEFNTVDALVHCAGSGSAAPTDLDSLEKLMVNAFRANTISSALLTEALSTTLTDGRARVVALGSLTALRGGGIAYATAKAALHGWAFSIARGLGARGITINVVAPGYVADTEFFGGPLSPERQTTFVSQTLNQRPGSPNDVAAMVEYLVSADSGHVTAQVLQVNGGALPVDGCAPPSEESTLASVVRAFQ